MKKNIKIKVEFPESCQDPWKVIERAIKEQCPEIEITKIRYTYFESNFGMCNFPPGLILANFMEENGPLKGWNWYLFNLSGTYELEIFPN